MDQKTLLEELKLHLGLATYKQIADTLGVSEIAVSSWMAGRRTMQDPTRKLAESLIQGAKDKKISGQEQKTVAEEGRTMYVSPEDESSMDQKDLLQTLRQAYGLSTQQEIADLLGVSIVTVQKWQYGTRNMRESTRRQIRLLLTLKDRISQK